MEELIYKRDVLHAIYKEWQGCSSKYGAYDIIYDTTDAIDKISPAENVKEIIYCRDCKHYNSEIHQCGIQICSSMDEDDFCSKGDKR